MPTTRHLNGWKAIGLHFGRDRTTVMRWARTRGMPVHRLPGGAKATVFALTDELDEWARGQAELEGEPHTDGPSGDECGGEASAGGSVRTGGRRPRSRNLTIAVAVAAAIVCVAAWQAWPQRHGRSLARIPSDPVAAARFLEARDLWAERSSASIRRSVSLLQQVTAREPGNALGWSGLADAYLLAREFAGLPDEEAFPKAEAAANRALAIDPDLAAGHRARAFVLYWWEHDPVKAGAAFRRALELAPDSAQTHFWYGNVLSDNGQHALALRELNTARLIEPGSIAIQTDLAYAQWAAGDVVAAREALNRIAASQPDFAEVHDCLGVMKLADGDYAGYVRELREYARTTDDADLAAFAASLQAALGDGNETVQGLLVDRAVSEIAQGRRRDYSWPVFLASVAQNRAQVMTFLHAADRRGEVWGAAGRNARIAPLWQGDREIQELLLRRKPPPVV